MVLLLSLDIFHHRSLFRLAVGNGAIAYSPPFEHGKLAGMAFDEVAGRLFQLPYKIGQANVGAQRNKHVDVVGHGVDPEKADVMGSAVSQYVCVEVPLMGFVDGSLGLIGAKYDVVIEFGVTYGI